MIDIESEIFTILYNKLTTDYTGIDVIGETNLSPIKFPCVCIEETDSYYFVKSQTNDMENHDVLIYEINIYSDKLNGKKSQCKQILSTIDSELQKLNFNRLTAVPLTFDNGTKYRIFARYQVVVSKDKELYRL